MFFIFHKNLAKYSFFEFKPLNNTFFLTLGFINLTKFINATQFINNDYLYDVELFLLSRILKIEPLNIDVYEVSANVKSNINLVDDSIEMFRKLKKIKVQYKNLF